MPVKNIAGSITFSVSNPGSIHPITRYSVGTFMKKYLAFAVTLLGMGKVIACTTLLVGNQASADGSFIIVYLANENSDFELELTWLRDMDRPYNLGDCEFHLAFRTDDYEAAHAKHEAMGCICYENPQMGIYFIKDPDGYWLEVLPPIK